MSYVLPADKSSVGSIEVDVRDGMGRLVAADLNMIATRSA
jgi:hypothetical protein